MSSMGFNSMACLQSAAGAAGMNGSSIMTPHSASSLGCVVSAPTTPYPNPSPSSTTSHYSNMYKDSAAVAAGYPGMSSSIASLRLKAKQHQSGSGFGSYSPPLGVGSTSGGGSIQPPLSPRSSTLSACQYGTEPDRSLI